MYFEYHFIYYIIYIIFRQGDTLHPMLVLLRWAQEEEVSSIQNIPMVKYYLIQI